MTKVGGLQTQTLLSFVFPSHSQLSFGNASVPCYPFLTFSLVCLCLRLEITVRDNASILGIVLLKALGKCCLY